MAYKNPHNFLLEISPEKSFVENWAPFKSIHNLYVPVSLGTELAIDPHSEQEILEFIDIASAHFSQDMKVGLVYTDPGLSTSSSLLAEVDSIVGLKRFSKNKSIQGLTFNPPMENDDQKLAFTAYKSILPRVIGYLSCKDDVSQNLSEMPKLSENFHKQNRVYEALHTAALAREEGVELDSCFFVELDSLFSLGMVSEAYQLLQWYEGSDPRIELFRIRFKSLSGHLHESMDAIKPFLKNEDTAALAWLEQGRALIMQNKAKQAVTAFDRSLQIEPSCDAMLGKGIALRAIYYTKLDEGGLNESLTQFENVIAINGYHAAEALHHAGTIHSALQQWDQATSCYREALRLAPSPVSKQNLALSLHAAGDEDGAIKEYEYLSNFYPAYAQSIAKYFDDFEVIFTPEDDSTDSDDLIAKKEISPADLEQMASEARGRLKKRRITMKNDIMDFRRVDDYVNYHAPAGVFLDSSSLFQLGEREYKNALFDIALHLGQLLVDEELATWQIEPQFSAIQIGLVIDSEQQQLPISMFSNIARRVEAGGSDNAMVSLEALVSHFPDYKKLLKDYSNPFLALPADEERLEEFYARADRAQAVLQKLGFSLTKTITDIRELEIAIASTWSDQGGLSELTHNDRLNYELIDDIGFYLGTLFEELALGEWHDHNDLNGISLQSMMIKNIHPVLELRKRFEMGAEANEMNSLLIFEPPLVCAHLCSQMQDNLISTREELLELIVENLPTIVDEDPSGNSINQMADMITAFAATKS